jgi:hypothetical protein
MAAGEMKRFYTILGVLAVAGLAVIGYLVMRRPTISIPANVQVLPADTAGFRGYFLGSDSAPIEITEYADYQCPACQDFETVQMPSVEERLIQTGRVRWRYRDFPLDQIHRHTRVAAHSAACADEQGKYWEQHHRIYSWTPDWTTKSDPTESSGIMPRRSASMCEVRCLHGVEEVRREDRSQLARRCCGWRDVDAYLPDRRPALSGTDGV